MTVKARDGEVTRSRILAQARAQFGERGFERTTIRSVASAAGVDPALVMHYFGNKAQLFAAASRLAITFPDLTGVPPERVVDLLLPVFVDAWGPRPVPAAAALGGHQPVAADALLGVSWTR